MRVSIKSLLITLTILILITLLIIGLNTTRHACTQDSDCVEYNIKCYDPCKYEAVNRLYAPFLNMEKALICPLHPDRHIMTDCAQGPETTTVCIDHHCTNKPDCQATCQGSPSQFAEEICNCS